MMRENCERLPVMEGYPTRQTLILAAVATVTASLIVSAIVAGVTVRVIGPRIVVNNNIQTTSVTRSCCEEFESAETQDSSTGHLVQSETEGARP